MNINEYLCIEDLTGIPEKKRNEIIKCLDELMALEYKEVIIPIITGYNWYKDVPKQKAMFTIAHIHESEDYKKDMLNDFKKAGYKNYNYKIRKKSGKFIPKIRTFRIRDDEGNLYPGLRVKDMRNREYIDLEKYTEPLGNYSEFENAQGYLLSEDYGWELNFSLNRRKKMINIIELFTKKARSKIINNDGIKIENKDAWRDAYDTPVIILGKNALKYKNKLPDFVTATKIGLIEGDNEISFIINERLEDLKELSHYQQLLDFGFNEELCLGNKSFVYDYVDKLDIIKKPKELINNGGI